MPAPASSNGLSLGRPLVDLAAIESIDDVRDALGKIMAAMIGMGWPCGAEKGDDVYQSVFYRGGDFYGGKPSDPLNPDLLLASAGGTIVVQDEGTPLGSPVGTINFIGAGVTAVLNGAVADVTVSGGGGGSSNSFETINCPSGTDPVAGSATDTLNLTATGIITITGDSATNTVAIGATLAEGYAIDVSGNSIAWDPTEIADYSGANNQFLWQRAGTFEWESITGYDDTETQSLGHINGAWTAKDVDAKTIWGIDPDGGHTLAVVGGELKLTLKITKYTFDLSNLTAEEDVDLEIDCTDVEDCEGA